MLRNLLRRLTKLLLWLVAGSALLVLALRWIDPPGTALMVERKVQSWIAGEPLDLQRTWRPWSELPDDLKIAVIAGEDQKFAEHWGFDIAAIRQALAHNAEGGNLRGASTISQQVAKNLFLWSDRCWRFCSTSWRSSAPLSCSAVAVGGGAGAAWQQWSMRWRWQRGCCRRPVHCRFRWPST